MNDYYCQMNLRLSTNVDQVVETAELFVATLTARELDTMPEGCQPRTIRSREDIVHWAGRLGEFETQGPLATSPEFAVVHRFFRGASARITEIFAEGRDIARARGENAR
jgi:hypothetical protein